MATDSNYQGGMRKTAFCSSVRTTDSKINTERRNSMFTKTKSFFKKALSTVLSATTIFSGMALAGTIAASSALPVAAAEATPATFSWDNVTVYFLLTDRFNNGDKSNDNAYGRQDINVGDTRATFHGGDFKGITDKITEGYFDDLGVTAIWLTAPYEQIHGYIQGGDTFWHYSYHGYYVCDYTEPDKAYGTAAEFQTLVDTAHEHGIRIIMDIVMNHAGYNSMLDMSEFGFGTLKSGWESYYRNPPTGNTKEYHDYIDYETSASDWGRWWGSDWIRSGLPGYADKGGNSPETESLQGLPDFRTETSTQVTVPQFLIDKWTKEGTLAAKQSKFGTSNTVTGFISSWLADWVRTYGVDGFRCDTAKHVDKASWGKLKQACVAALKDWKAANPSKKLDDLDFWMTGEHWDHGVGKDDYYTTGGFDSMINFDCTGGGVLAKGSVAGKYKDYAAAINSDPTFNVLSYISSHDSTLARPDDMYYIGSAFLLLPGGVQIYYGDETARALVPGVPNDGGGGAGHSLRSDMPWSSLDTDLVKHWGIVGRFRRSHVAIGAGQNLQLTASSGIGFGRSYSNNGLTDKAAGVIGVSANTDVSLEVTGLWEDGTMLTNYYDDSSATVSGGKVIFNSGAHGTILIAEPDGSKGRVTVKHIDQDSSKVIETKTLSGMVGDSYTAEPLKTEGFTVAKTVGKTTGTFTEADQEVTFYYTFDSDNYGYVVTKFVKAEDEYSQLADSVTEVGKVGSTYTTVPADIKDYEVDLSLTSNATGTVKKGTTTVIYKYKYVEPTNLKVHYYNSKGWSTVQIYAYDESSGTAKEYTGAWASAKQMTAEGDGWFVADVPDTESATVIFHNGAGDQEPAGVGTPGYAASGECWIKDGKVSAASKVQVLYVTDGGKTLGSETLKGMSGDTYNTTAKTFDGYKLVETPSNATGTYGTSTTTVKYVYKSTTPDPVPVPETLKNNSKISATTITVGSSVTLTGSASGGTKPYTYAATYKKSTDSSYTLLRAYSSTTTATFKPAHSGTYTVRMTVKDNDGKTATKSFTLKVNPKSTTTAPTNNSTISATSLYLGDYVTLKGAATGGTSPYKYAFFYKKSTYTYYRTLKALSTSAVANFKPTEVGTYSVKVTVEDKNGKTADKTFTVYAKQKTTALANKSTMSATKIELGKSVTLKGVASGGTSPYTYASYYKKTSATYFTLNRNYSSTATMTFKPSAAGTYDVRVYVKDKAGKKAYKDFKLTVTKPLTNSTTVNTTSVTINKIVTVTGKASGGKSPYKYAAYVKKSGAQYYSTLRDFSTTATVYFKPKAVGTYYLKIRVKDSAGATKDKIFTIKANPLPLANNSKVSATSIEYGKSVTITGAASGGVAPYSYAAYHKIEGASSYTTIRGYNTYKTITFKPAKAGTYTVLVKVKDSQGTIKSKTFKVTMKSAPLANACTISTTSIKLGSSVKVTCKATGGTKPYRYAAWAKYGTNGTYHKVKDFGTYTAITFKPAKAGTYTLRVKVRDGLGTIKSKNFTIKVTKPVAELVNKSKLSASTIKLGKTVTVTCAATGGTTPYQYQVSYKKASTSTYTTVQDYSTNKTVTIKPGAATTYQIRIKVKDKAGKVSTSVIALNVTK